MARKSPLAAISVRGMIERGITSFEDMRGLNVGGRESGRLAKAYATMKYLRSQLPNPTPEDLDQIRAIGRDMTNPAVEFGVQDWLQRNTSPKTRGYPGAKRLKKMMTDSSSSP